MKHNIFKSSKIIIIMLLLSLISTNVFAAGVVFNNDLEKVSPNYVYYKGFSDDLIAYNNTEDSWNIIKSDGEVIKLKGKYIDYCDTVIGKYYNFNDDYYRFLINNNYGSTSFIYVSKTGVESLIEGYTYASPTLNENYLYIWKEEKNTDRESGLYNINTKSEIIPLKYEDLKYINDSLIVAGVKGKYGIINISQQEIIPFHYDYLEYVNDNFIIAKQNGKYGVININKEQIIPYEYNEISIASGCDGFCKIIKDDKANLIDSYNINIIIPYESEDSIYLDSGFFINTKNGKRGILNSNGVVIAQYIYDNIDKIGEYFVVSSKGLAGVLDNNGKEVIPLKYKEILDIKDNEITAAIETISNERKYGVFDFKGKEIITPIYDYLEYSSLDKYMIVQRAGFGNLINKRTKLEVLPHKYSEVKYLNDKYLAASNGDGFGIINYEGQRLTPFLYNKIYPININDNELYSCEISKGDLIRCREVDYYKSVTGPSEWAREEILKSIDKNIIPKEMQAAFRLNINREEFCKLIVAFIEEKNHTKLKTIISENYNNLMNNILFDSNVDEVMVCNYFGIIKGKGAYNFDLEGEITREEASVMLTNLSKYLNLNSTISDKTMNIKDKNAVSEWAVDSVNYVLQHEYMRGIDKNIFSPKTKITREQAYITMSRMLKAVE